MINPLNRTGHNIKKLRNSYGETQQELGDVIGVSASAIANYEKGTREVDLQKLQAIAAHYGCSVEKIVNNNIVFHNLQNITFGWHTVTDLIPIVFPIFCSEKALEDIDFKKAHEHNKNILKSIDSGEGSTHETFYACIDSYATSIENLHTIESIANILGVLLMLYSSFIADENDINVYETMQKSKSTGRNFNNKSFLKNITPEENNEKMTYVQAFIEITTPFIQMIKKESEWIDFAYYYSALLYFFKMVNNGYSDDFNREVGMEMMKSLANLDNEYAKSFIEPTDKYLTLAPDGEKLHNS